MELTMSLGEKGATAEQATQAHTVEVPEEEGTSCRGASTCPIPWLHPKDTLGLVPASLHRRVLLGSKCSLVRGQGCWTL